MLIHPLAERLRGLGLAAMADVDPVSATALTHFTHQTATSESVKVSIP